MAVQPGGDDRLCQGTGPQRAVAVGDVADLAGGPEALSVNWVCSGSSAQPGNSDLRNSITDRNASAVVRPPPDLACTWAQSITGTT